MLKTSTKRRIADQWGYIGVVVTALLLLTLFQQPTKLALIGVLLLSVADVGFFLLYAKMPCGVKNRREGFCRNRGFGFLGGCTRVEGHRWIKLKSLFTRDPYVASVSGLLSKFSGKAAAVGSGASVVIALMGVLTFIFGPAVR